MVVSPARIPVRGRATNIDPLDHHFRPFVQTLFDPCGRWHMDRKWAGARTQSSARRTLAVHPSWPRVRRLRALLPTTSRASLGSGPAAPDLHLTFRTSRRAQLPLPASVSFALPESAVSPRWHQAGTAPSPLNEAGQYMRATLQELDPGPTARSAVCCGARHSAAGHLPPRDSRLII